MQPFYLFVSSATPDLAPGARSYPIYGCGKDENTNRQPVTAFLVYIQCVRRNLEPAQRSDSEDACDYEKI